MEFDFSAVMKKTSDTELIKIVTTDRSDYQEAALIAAEAELAVRNLNVSTVEAVKKNIEKEQKAAALKAETPLEVHWKMFAFIFPIIFLFIMAGLFKANGYERKSKELAKWTFFGLGFYLIIVVYNILEQ